jgi:hypothetical protein
MSAASGRKKKIKLFTTHIYSQLGRLFSIIYGLLLIGTCCGSFVTISTVFILQVGVTPSNSPAITMKRLEAKAIIWHNSEQCALDGLIDAQNPILIHLFLQVTCSTALDTV